MTQAFEHQMLVRQAVESQDGLAGRCRRVRNIEKELDIFLPAYDI